MNIYKNNFHNTETSSKLTLAEYQEAQYIDGMIQQDERTAEESRLVRTMKRIEKKLCGMADCNCLTMTDCIEK